MCVVSFPSWFTTATSSGLFSLVSCSRSKSSSASALKKSPSKNAHVDWLASRRQHPTEWSWPFSHGYRGGVGEQGGGGGGGGRGGVSGIHFIHNNALQRPGRGQITSINDATHANFKMRGAASERLSLDWFSGLQEGRVLTMQTGERETEREM